MRKYFSSRAFSLTEVTIALGIIGFCALAVMGLIPIAAKSYRQSYDQTQAAQILVAFANGFHSPATNGGYTLPAPFSIAINSSSSNTIYFTDNNAIVANTNATGTNTARYKLTYNISVPTTSFGGIYGATAALSISWPAAATNPQGNLNALIYYNLPPQ